MAGPVCNILIPPGPIGPSEQAVADWAEQLMALVSELREGEDFSVVRTTAIGGQYVGEGQPYLQLLEPFALDQDGPERSLADKAALVQLLGWVPQCEVQLIAMCSGPHNHRILGELALWWLSACPKVVVDLGDDLAALRALPVWTLQAPCEMGEGELGFETLTDADGLRAWLASDGFHMVK